ncbi:cation:proton antiporter [uncultured Helicobacter sp.]|uniref:cation:proton antiporter n=1 Tax=uncultured Helicobacter sp. TaxID=175537 RepID=UPI00374FD8D4
MDLFTTITLALALSVVFGIIFSKLKIPVLIGYIVTGVVVSYFVRLNSEDASHLREIAEYGIVFLMFLIGVEFSFNKMRKMKQEVVVFGSMQLGLSMLLFFLGGYYFFGFGLYTSLIIASALSLSSTAIVLKYLKDSRQIETGYGKSSVGILIMQDIAVIPILLMIAMMSNKDLILSDMLLKTFISVAILLFVLFFPGRYLAKKMLRFTAGMNTDEIFVAAVLLIVLGSSLISSYFGFSASLGAFLAGMIISNTPYRYQVESVLINFRDILLGVFFITIGMQVKLDFLVQYFLPITALILCTMLGKTLVVHVFLRFFCGDRIAFKTALSLSQIGEFSFAVFLIASSHQVLNLKPSGGLIQHILPQGFLESITTEEIYQFLTLMVIFSMIATPFILEKLESITNFTLTRLGILKDKSSEHDLPSSSESLHNHYIVCGYGNVGRETIKRLQESGKEYIAIDNNPTNVRSGLDKGDNVIFANLIYGNIFQQVGIQECAGVIIAIDSVYEVRSIYDKIRSIAPACKIFARISAQGKKEGVDWLDFSAAVDEPAEIANLLVQIALAKEDIQ